MFFLSIILIVVFSLKKLSEDDYVIDPELIEEINSDPSIPWTAGVNSVFVGKTLRDVVNLLIPHEVMNQRKQIISSFNGFYDSRRNEIPKEFDTYTNWPHCIHGIRNQGQCGSCWAFSAVEAMGDRFCTQGIANVTLSPQELVSCETDEYACQGGYLSREWEYLKNTGVVTESCFPYKSKWGKVPKCPNKCVDEEDWNKKYKVSSYVNYKNVSQAQEGLMKYGSFQAAFEVYDAFFSYTSGVYDCRGSRMEGGHAVKIQGWGVDSKTTLPYWNVANSWGKQWGMKGYFWIHRGDDCCAIEDQMWGGIPQK